MDPDIIDKIYEASFVPELWRGVLGELAELAEARAGFLFVSNNTIHDWASSTVVGTEALRPLVESGWVARSERFRRFMSTTFQGFLSDTDIYTAEEMQSDPFYQSVLYPRGLGFAAATAIELPTGDRFAISLERERQMGPPNAVQLQRLDALRPHLARSALLFARLQLERAHAASETLAAIGLPSIVMNEGGQVLAANHLIEQMSEYILWLARDRIALKDQRANTLLRAALTSGMLETANGVRSFPARHADAEHSMIVHVIPIRLSARDIFARGVVALVLTPVTMPQAPPVELVRCLFDLTAAEANVARSLASGQTVDQIAAARGLSANTIRTQIRAVLAKTGFDRQTDVVALLTGIWLPRQTRET